MNFANTGQGKYILWVALFQAPFTLPCDFDSKCLIDITIGKTQQT